MAPFGIYIAIFFGLLIPVSISMICSSKELSGVAKLFSSLIATGVIGALGYFAFLMWALHTFMR